MGSGEGRHRFHELIKAHKYIFHTASFQKWSKHCSLLLNLWDFSTGMADEVCYQSHKALLILSQLQWLLTLNGTNLAIVVPEVVHLHIFSNANYIFDLKKRLVLSPTSPLSLLPDSRSIFTGPFLCLHCLASGSFFSFFFPFYLI